MLSTLERTLRNTSLVSSVLAIVLGIPAAVASTYVRDCSGYGCSSPGGIAVITFGFIPLFFTIVTSLFYVALQRRNEKEKVAATHNPLPWIMSDFLIFAGYVVTLVFEWVKGEQRLTGRPDIAFLEAYATVPLMVNMFIHMLTFFIKGKMGGFRVLLAWKWKVTSECPHCHHRIGGRTEEVVQKRSGEGYSLLRGEDYDDDAGRASEDRAAIGAVGEV